MSMPVIIAMLQKIHASAPGKRKKGQSGPTDSPTGVPRLPRHMDCLQEKQRHGPGLRLGKPTQEKERGTVFLINNIMDNQMLE